MKVPREISDRVLVVGIDPTGKGGVATVIRQQQKMMESFNFLKIAKEGWQKYILPAVAMAKSPMYLPSKYEIVHVHACSDIDFYRSALFIYLFKAMGKKVIMHMHGAMFENFYHNNPSLVRKVCGKCDMIVTVSNYFVRFFESEKLNRCVRLLHNNIEPHIACKSSNKPDGMTIFSYFGAIDDRKGIFECIEAIGENAEEFRGKAEFHLGGNGNVARLESMITKYGIDDIVKFHGWIGPAEKHELLSNTDVFLHPSKFESFGISILEAMDYGLPIITTETGGITDLVTDGINGLTVKPGDSQMIATAMLRLMSDSDLRQKLGAESARRAKTFYPDPTAQKLTDLYTELLG